MADKKNLSPYHGCGSITREQFLFKEMRIVARLIIDDGLTEQEIIKKVEEENLFQYPTEKMINNLVKVCLKRYKAIDSPELIEVIAHSPLDIAKQACLYLMMKYYRLVRDFMIQVVGEKYNTRDLSYGKGDINRFFLQLQEQYEEVAGWSDATIQKLKQVLNKLLVDTGYLDNVRADHLNPVWLYNEVENVIRDQNDQNALIAFNRLN